MEFVMIYADFFANWIRLMKRIRIRDAKIKRIQTDPRHCVQYLFLSRFDMLEKRKDENLSNEQRRNLAHVAKILQFAASKIGQL